MYATDFEYDGQSLSDLGYIVCDFSPSYDFRTVNIGSKISMNKVSRNHGRDYSLTSAAFDDAFESDVFGICKDPDLFDPDEMYFSDEEIRQILRWLNRTTFCEFKTIDDEEKYYNATFNVEPVFLIDKCVGFEATMMTDSAFAHGEEFSETFEFTENQKSNIVNYSSDDIAQSYPSVSIKCLAAGDLEIRNLTADTLTIIKNVAVNEIITINEKTLIIETNKNAHDIQDDFNYQFIPLCNTLTETENEITANLPCEITFTYRPIIKSLP